MADTGSSTTRTQTLIEELLADQQRLQTPVARFSDAHGAAVLSQPEAVYRDLIPLTAPAADEQYAFEVDLDSCTGCKACVAGCHSLNGLDDEETWRDIGTILGGDRRHPFQQTITTACHHCADPACLNGCPVLAYEKDDATGIVRHLDDQCIGCQYCVLKCPYDVPKYSERLGIVRKCDMCHSRLAAGEAPACVQACPTEAIRIVTVKTYRSSTGASTDTTQFLPASVAPASDYTQPTTRYISKRALPENVAAADASRLILQPPHWPLVLMLTFVPMAVGCFALEAAFPRNCPDLDRVGLAAGFVGLVSSVFHLGQPLRAWRIFLGLKQSWLSREAVVFGLWFGLAASQTLFRLPLSIATGALGLTGLWCSCMIYADTRRHFWRLQETAPRFFGTALILAVASAFVLRPDGIVAIALATAVLAKLAVETRIFQTLDKEDETPRPALKTALLLSGPLRNVMGTRYVVGLLGGVAAPVLIAVGGVPSNWAWLVLAMALGGEVSERYLYFRAVAPMKMPGVNSR